MRDLYKFNQFLREKSWKGGSQYKNGFTQTLSKWLSAAPTLSSEVTTGWHPSAMENPKPSCQSYKKKTHFLEDTVKHWCYEYSFGVSETYVNPGFIIYQLCEV